MKRIHRIQRANAHSRRNMLEAHKIQAMKEWQGNIRRDGKRRRLSVVRCDCGDRHWAHRTYDMTENQKKVNKLCNTCFQKKYKKSRPPNYAQFVFRLLSEKETHALERYYQAMGVTIIDS